MKNIIVPVFILLIFTSIGCVDDPKPKVQKTNPPSTILQLLTGDPNANKTQTTQPGTQPTTTPLTIPSTSVSTARLNPAHGQPGHRCDIAVGAPLDSKPGQSTIQTPSTEKTITPLNTPSATGKALNPAHGQPGHRCDIAVGAPLDSKPIQTTTQTQTQSAVKTTTPLSIPSATEDGLNPAHGKPGHRCDIAVGAPLNSKPAPKQ